MDNQVPTVSTALYNDLTSKYEKAKQHWQDVLASELAKHIPFRFLVMIPQSLHCELIVVFTKVNNATDVDVIRNARVFLEKFENANEEFIEWFTAKLAVILKDYN